MPGGREGAPTSEVAEVGEFGADRIDAATRMRIRGTRRCGLAASRRIQTRSPGAVTHRLLPAIQRVTLPQRDKQGPLET